MWLLGVKFTKVCPSPPEILTLSLVHTEPPAFVTVQVFLPPRIFLLLGFCSDVILWIHFCLSDFGGLLCNLTSLKDQNRVVDFQSLLGLLANIKCDFRAVQLLTC